jgi:hypothetical protein
MDKNTGFIVILAYPEVVVRIANGELISKIWPLFGIGGQNKVMAGHAAMLLVSKKTNKINYFDFGRYITSDTYGRVRSEETDNEVHIPTIANHNSKRILNLEEVLLFLDKNPKKTHGEGRMVVGVNSEIDYDKALAYILDLQDKGEVPYRAFTKKGSNCARFVTDTILASTTNKKIVRKLQLAYALTPSPVGNVLKGSTDGLLKLQIENHRISPYVNNSAFKEHKKHFLTKVSQQLNDIGSIYPDLGKYNSLSGQWLGGIGSGAWFELNEKCKDSKLYHIERRNLNGEIDLAADFITVEEGFSFQDGFRFQHGSNCKICLLKQKNKVYTFARKVE